MNIQFFWEKKNKKGTTRSRFNLLLLEFGEYYLEDFSAYQFGLGIGESINEDLKIQGRLKMSSRSLVFEPNEVRYPLLRFPFKNMQTDLVELKAERLGMSLQLTGVFTFSCTQYFEMKAHNKIGPFKVVELPRPTTPSDGNSVDANAFRFVFALVHSRLDDLQLKVEQFRHIVKISDRMGNIVANQHLRPFIEHALISTFDSSNLVDFHEKYLLNNPLTTRKILPLVSHPGSLMITESRLYFQPAQLNNIGDASQKFELRKVSRIYKRRYLLRPTGLEFFLEDGSSHLFVFESREERDHVYDLVNTKSAYSRRAIVTLDEITRKWQRREISNFQYLMHLNNEAGRTTNDLTQYPVFPHILSDYRSKKLNFESSAIYRDLSKPIGALNADRLEFFRERFESMPPADPALGLPPPFLYGTHYSTPGYVLFYLVRVAPEYMLCLQNGRFDAPDRMFHSVADMWDSCLNNPADLKELIPEFFTGTGDFLSNADDLDLGHRSSGERLHDVVLPPWADSPRDFIRKHAKALESEYVSDHLHEWIDLIFGHKQQGPAAVEADNLFYYLTYEKAVDLDAIKDPRERAAIENQIQEFGQTPSQLFLQKHPRRNDLSAPVITTQSATVASSVLPDATLFGSERKTLSPSPSSQTQSSAQQTPSGNNSTNINSLASASGSGKSRHGSWNSLLGGSNKSPSSTNNATPGASVSSFTSAFSSILQPRPVSSVNRLINNSSSSPLPGIAPRPGTPTAVFGNNLLSPVVSTASVSLGQAPDDDVPIVHLGDDFRQALESEELIDSDSGKVGLNYGNDDSVDLRTDGGRIIASGLDKNVGSSDNEENPSIISRGRNGRYFDSSKLRLFPSELFYWHTKSVTDIALRITRCDVPNTSDAATYEEGTEVDMDTGMNSHCYLPLSGRRKLSAILATVSKDSLLKIVRIEQDLDMSQLYHPAAGFSGNDNNSMLACRTQCTISRSFSASGSSLSSCALTQDSLKVVLGSWDNHVYGYNISSATPAGKKFAHYDSVTCLSIDEQDSMLATGSLDGTVKLWHYRMPTGHTQSLSSVSSAAGFLPGGAIVEFEDHEYPVMKVAITSWEMPVPGSGMVRKRLVAGAAEDGGLVVWDAETHRTLCTFQTSANKRPVTCLLWLHHDISGQQWPRLIVATQDGRLLCLDVTPPSNLASSTSIFTASLVTALQSDAAVLCLGNVFPSGSSGDITASSLLGGCADGSVRLWTLQYPHSLGGVGIMSSNSSGMMIRELQRWNKAHSGPVTALALAAVNVTYNNSGNAHTVSNSMPCEMMVTGSEDCSVKVWRLAFDR